MFEKSQQYYDAIYSWKDYAGEAEELRRLIVRENPNARTLLDVACGTGMHLATFRKSFECEGVDLDPEMLRVAKVRLPELTFHESDLRDFRLNRSYDVVTCLFSSIAYATTRDALEDGVASMVRHLNPGGILLIEPWFSADQWHDKKLSALFVDRKDLKIARMNVSCRTDNCSDVRFYYMVGTPEGITHFEEHHVMGLFEPGEYRNAIEKQGLSVHFEESGPSGRGLWVGKRVS